MKYILDVTFPKTDPKHYHKNFGENVNGYLIAPIDQSQKERTKSLKNEKTLQHIGEIMPYCPQCGALVVEDSTTCKNCGANLRLKQPRPSQSSQSAKTAPSPPAQQSSPKGNAGESMTFGVVSAILSLFVLPEIFGSAAIILGAYVWRKEQGNRGVSIVVFGIICMLVGLVFTSFFALVDMIPS